MSFKKIYWVKKNYFNIISGNITSTQDRLQDGGMVMNSLNTNSYCNLTSIGLAPCNTYLMGVEAEDSMWFDKIEKIKRIFILNG